MKKTIQQGISLIALVITILVLIILAAVTVPKIQDRANQATLATHNTNLSNFREEVESYMYSHEGKLPVLLETTGEYKVYNLVEGSPLKKEIYSCGDATNTFYMIDVKALGANNPKDGLGKDSDDYYIVASKTHNVYYAKGRRLNKTTYFGTVNQQTIKLIAEGMEPSPVIEMPTDIGIGEGTPNPPKLGEGMVPQKFISNDWADADTSNANNEWYDYSNTSFTKNRWANVRLADGSQFVWIPRYSYKISSGEHTDTAGVINVRFSNGINDDTSDGYRVPTAFYWGGFNLYRDHEGAKVVGGVELTGIWIAKYEPSDNGGKIQIKPGITSIRNIDVNTMFTKCRNMQDIDYATYGISPIFTIMDTHMMKNSEWGAVAYLSKYARGTEVSINSDGGYNTGGANNVNAYKTNTNQSTTQNVYGVYDMSGCAWEYMASYINNSNSNLNANGSSIISADARYKDILPVGLTDSSQNDYDALKYAYGHAIYETSLVPSIWNGTDFSIYKYGWFADSVEMRYGSWPWVLRGGSCGNVNAAGLFAFSSNYGGTIGSVGYRVVVVCM